MFLRDINSASSDSEQEPKESGFAQAERMMLCNKAAHFQVKRLAGEGNEPLNVSLLPVPKLEAVERDGSRGAWLLPASGIETAETCDHNTSNTQLITDNILKESGDRYQEETCSSEG